MTDPQIPSDKLTSAWSPSEAAREESRFPPGTLLAGRYRVVYPLGQGGMGEVYRAEDLKLGQTVALKFVRHSLASSAKRHLYDEVRLGRQVSHPNVCRLYDIVEVDGTTFIAMEYVDGEDLASLLARIGHLPPDKALDIARDLCAGLQAAHDRGVLHRDLKPSNVMIDGRGRARLTDFGLAVPQAADAQDSEWTGRSPWREALGAAEAGKKVDGTPLYMSPEQLAGGELSVRSDLYSLGLVLYEMVAGGRFFSARTLDELRSQHRTERLARLGELSGQVDPAFQRVIAQCLEEDPSARPASARGVLALLPGGDPLEAAIAAGETPSPEAVAAAGTVGDLRPAVAWAGLGVALGGIALGVILSSRLDMIPRNPPPKTPDVLVERARTVLSQVWKGPAPADWVAHFEWDQKRFDYVGRNDLSPHRFDRLRDSPLSPLVFFYRQSPGILATIHGRGVVQRTDPPLDVPGMATVVLDPQGRLTGYVSVPPTVEAGGPWPEPDWSPLFREAGLEPTAFRAVSPEWAAPVDSDSKAAWEGVYPGMPEVELRIEAAAYHGQVVWFALLPPWASPNQPQSLGFSGDLAPVALALWSFMSWVLPLAALLLARRNLRLRRVDWRGSLRLALFVLASFGLARLFSTDHVTDTLFVPLGFIWLFGVLSGPMLFAALIWVGYLALEPYARRQWPRVLISWGRLLAGRWRDPMVGRDVLLGAAGGAVFAVAAALMAQLWPAIGQPQGPWLDDPDALTSWSTVVFRVLVNLYGATLHSIQRLFLLVLLRVLLRRERLALGVWGVLLSLTVMGWDFSNYDVWAGVVDVVFFALFVFLHVLVLTRLGLLGYASMLFVIFVVGELPLSLDASLWWAPRGWVALAVLAALCIWAFRTSLAGKPALGDWLEA